jgi:hypothetical protein
MVYTGQEKNNNQNKESHANSTKAVQEATAAF